MKTIYLANPYGFSTQQRNKLLPELVVALQRLGLEVWEPFERNDQTDFGDDNWPYTVGQADVNDVELSDGFFGVVNGCPPDEGVMIELGIAIARRKPIFLFRDDFRRCTDSVKYPLNLMLFAGLPGDDWEKSYYTSVSELRNPDKALAQWARGGV